MALGFLYLLSLALTITFLCLGMYGVTLFTAIPMAFLIPIHLTFFYQPGESGKSYVFIYLLSFARLLCMTLAILIPALIWNFIPWIKEGVNALWIIFPASEVLFVYIINIVCMYQTSRQEEKNEKK